MTENEHLFDGQTVGSTEEQKMAMVDEGCPHDLVGPERVAEQMTRVRDVLRTRLAKEAVETEEVTNQIEAGQRAEPPGARPAGKLHLSDKLRLQVQTGEATDTLENITDDYHEQMHALGALSLHDYDGRANDWELETADETIVAHAMEILPHLGPDITAAYLTSATKEGGAA